MLKQKRGATTTKSRMGQTTSKKREHQVSMPRGDIILPTIKTQPQTLARSTANVQIEPFRFPKFSGSTRYTSNFEPRVPTIPTHVPIFNPQPPARQPPQPPLPSIEPKPTQTYSTWTREYLNFIKQKDDLRNYDSRNRRDEEQRRQRELEEKGRQIRFERFRAEAGLVTDRQYTRPALTLESCVNLGPRYAAYKDYDKKYFSTKPERPELTPDMLMLIEQASKPSPPTEVLSQIDGTDITRKDIRTLTGLNWLNDEIINAYMALIVARSREAHRKKVYAFNTFFYPKVKESGYGSVRRWTRKVDIFSYDFLLVPVHLGNHWCLALIDFTTKCICYYDSLGGSTMGCCDTLLDYLRSESNDKKKQDFDDENWKMLNCYAEIGIPQQRNGSDCGVFACIYAEYLTRGAELTFTQEHMGYFRKKMIYELIVKRILE